MKIDPNIRETPVLLVVDDDNIIRLMLRRGLERDGYRIVEAADGQTAMAEFVKHQPDMVLLDAVMPGMDGFEVCQWLQEQPNGERCPCLLITVLNDDASVDRGFTAGATDFITKPIHWAVLRQRVRLLLQASRHEKQLRLSQLELTQHNQGMQFINELNFYLQMCPSLEGTHSIIEHYAKKIFADHTGVLYLFNENHSMLKTAARWGTAECLLQTAISPGDCWGLRQGDVHIVDGTDNVIVCNHIHDTCEHGYVCAPVIAQGETIGVLSVTLGSLDVATDTGKLQTSVESRTRLIAMAADNLAMALVSLKLREALRSRSVRDPLTKLFNRRYLEETLARELFKAKRSNQNLGVIMIDIDQFKKYNDTHGHDAGDFVLVEISDLLRSKLRESDIACRYGGEELVMVMPATTKEITAARAELMREAIEKHDFVYKGGNLLGVTVSLGVANYPADGDTSATLMKAADSALYEAKAAGRNRVVLA